MGLFSRMTNPEILRDQITTGTKAHEARKQGRHTEAAAADARYEEARKEMSRRYRAEAADPEAALLIRRAFDN